MFSCGRGSSILFHPSEGLFWLRKNYSVPFIAGHRATILFCVQNYKMWINFHSVNSMHIHWLFENYFKLHKDSLLHEIIQLQANCKWIKFLFLEGRAIFLDWSLTFSLIFNSKRCSASMNAFLSCLPQVLDQNHLMGKMLLPTSLLLLQHFISPAHTLWLLEPYARRSWLMTMIVLFYKVLSATPLVFVPWRGLKQASNL